MADPSKAAFTGYFGHYKNALLHAAFLPRGKE